MSLVEKGLKVKQDILISCALFESILGTDGHLTTFSMLLEQIIACMNACGSHTHVGWGQSNDSVPEQQSRTSAEADAVLQLRPNSADLLASWFQV